MKLKRLLLPLLAALALPTAVNAEYWVEIANFGSYIRWIDTHSIDRRGDWFHANIWQRYKNTKNYRKQIVGIKINCKRGVFTYEDYPQLVKTRQKNGLWNTRFTFKKATKEETAEGVYKMLCKRGE